jgi:membrane protein YdbS with pleckstrin-like domain
MSDQPTPVRPRLLRGASLADGEEIRAETRATALHYFPGPIAALILILGLDYAAIASASSLLPAVPLLTSLFGGVPTGAGWSAFHLLLGFFLILTLIVLVLLFARYLEWIRTVYAVTSSRVIVQQGVFSREFHEIPITQVRGVDVHQTFVHRLLGYGTMRVSSEGGAAIGNEDWVGIPDPFKFQLAIETANQNITRGRGPAMEHPDAPAPPMSRPSVQP